VDGYLAPLELLFHDLILFVKEVLFGGFLQVLKDFDRLKVGFIFAFPFDDLAFVVALINEWNELFLIIFRQRCFIYHSENH
jgi:hypothetical protein